MAESPVEMSFEMTPPNPTDLNSASEPNETHRSLRNAMVLWLIALSLAMLILPLYLVSAALRDDVVRLEAALRSNREALAELDTLSPDAQELVNSLAEAEALAVQIEEARANILADHTNWVAVMATIGNYDPRQLALTSLTHDDHRIILDGEAADDSAVMRYARDLEESDLFARVAVESINTIPMPRALATPTPTKAPSPETTLMPTQTITPTVIGTATPRPTDDYETDDFEPRSIALGQPQSHNFYPIYDVDQLKFLAKAGRHYRVFTFDLATGVDTFLAIGVAGISFSNDDRAAGDLSSEVVFQVGVGYDVHAIVKVTNRGQYGPDKRYQISVEEIAPPPTPTPSSTPTPATNTPTADPTDTLTPTPDPRDAYEPDTAPQSIAVGETQTHNFLPDHDVDKVEFLAKARRYYRVSTSELALGADTSLVVNVGGLVYTNDDRQPGDLSSEVVFQVGGDDRKTMVTVANHGQFGANMWYQITVEEIVTTPTTTPTNIPPLTSTGTPTRTDTPTPTPDLRDAFEPDDVHPRPVAAGETQTHNFSPAGDVDKVQFLAKAGRYYWVFTSGLRAGVDTFLTISVDGATYTNDDRQPGDLSSEIVFYVGPGRDVNALVTVTNRGRYGPQQWYDITVQEIIITPTPTPTPTNTSTLTPTAASTNTPTPPYTSTATHTPTTASRSSKLPGLALLVHSLDSADLSLPGLMIDQQGAISSLPSGWEGERGQGAFASQAVEFVIILELKARSP
jgi:hypothetical protein